MERANRYIVNNDAKFPMELYRVQLKSRMFPGGPDGDRLGSVSDSAVCRVHDSVHNHARHCSVAHLHAAVSKATSTAQSFADHSKLFWRHFVHNDPG